MSDKITIAASVALCKVLEGMLFEADSDQFKETDLPFNVRYKIQRNLDLLSKDRAFFEAERQNLIKSYGSPKDGEPNKIEVTPENIQKFQEEVIKIMSIEVEHNFFKFTPEEVFLIKDAKAKAFEMDLFIANLVEDPDRESDLNTPVSSKNNPEETK